MTDQSLEASAVRQSLTWNDRPRGYWVSLRVLVIGLADVVAFALAFALFRTGNAMPGVVFFPSNLANNTPIDIFIPLCCIFVVVRYIAGDYSRRTLFWHNARSTTLALLVTAMPGVLVSLLMPGQYSLGAELASWALLIFAVPFFRQATRIGLAKAGVWHLPTVLVALGGRTSDIFDAVENTISLGYKVRWIIGDGEEPQLPGNNTKRLSFDDPERVIQNLVLDGCERAVISTDDMQSAHFAKIVQHLIEAGINVSFCPSFRRLPVVGVTTSYFFGRDLLLFQMPGSLQRIPQRVLKRMFDILASLAGLILLSPVFLVITAILKAQYPKAPVFFGQKVEGRDGQIFKMWKFSTMRPDAHLVLEEVFAKNPELRKEWEETFKLKDDPRILPGIGKILRQSSLNELPQLFNVLVGDMSLVGPRPVKPQELIQFYGSAAQLYRRVRPGITGLWQVRGRSDTSYDERVVYDEWYVSNWSFWYDIVILVQTVWVVLRGKGAY